MEKLTEILTEMDIEIIKNMCEYDMNIAFVSRAMFMHWGSIAYHLDKIKRNTGLDPRVFYDLVELMDMLNAEKQTNADRMRTMNVEDFGENVKQAVIKWLQSEAEE